MGAITSRGRSGYTQVPNWRWEDKALDTYELRIAGWLTSHVNGWVEDHVSRNVIAQRTGVSQGKTSQALQALQALGVIAIIDPDGKGRRMAIEVDLEVWNRSPGDHPTGHDMTTNRSLGDHREEQVEEQDKKDAAPPPEPTLERALAQEVVIEWWESLPKKPSTGMIAFVKIAEKLITDGWTQDELRAGIKATMFRTKELVAWKRAQEASRPEPTKGIDMDIVKAWLDVEPWVVGKVSSRTGILGPTFKRVDFLSALQTLRRWQYGLGESLIRIACALRYAPQFQLCWDPKYLADDAHRVLRFEGMPGRDIVEPAGPLADRRPMSLVMCMDRAYDKQRWNK